MRRLAVLFALLAGLFGSAAHASVMVALDLADLVDQSDYIVVARPEQQSSRFSRGLIVTDVNLRVITALKGASAPGATLVATHLGGEIDDLALDVPGSARFISGQSAIVFLRRAPGKPDLNVVGMSQGVMPIVGSGPSAQVEAGGFNVALLSRDANGALVDKPSAPQSRTLTSVIDEIERLVGAR
jgi:hypothetical protein